jgi:hypothetical protein
LHQRRRGLLCPCKPRPGLHGARACAPNHPNQSPSRATLSFSRSGLFLLRRILLLPGRLLRRFLPCEPELKFRHPHFAAAELYALHFQTKALIEAVLAGKGDAASGGDHAMPGQSVGLAQGADHLARRAGKAGGAGDSAVTGNLAARDFHNRGANSREHLRVGGLCRSHGIDCIARPCFWWLPVK